MSLCPDCLAHVDFINTFQHAKGRQVRFSKKSELINECNSLRVLEYTSANRSSLKCSTILIALKISRSSGANRGSAISIFLILKGSGYEDRSPVFALLLILSATVALGQSISSAISEREGLGICDHRSLIFGEPEGFGESLGFVSCSMALSDHISLYLAEDKEPHRLGDTSPPLVFPSLRLFCYSILASPSVQIWTLFLRKDNILSIARKIWP